ncbi:MAG: hypothetical protein RLZ55_1645 [Actinomycetota bacterium]|jgi:predicted Zn-dependent protease
MTESPAVVVDKVLETARSAATVVAVETAHEANLRWALSMATTNGVVGSSTVTITAIADVADGRSTATRSGPVELWAALLAEAEAAAAGGSPAGEESPLPDLSAADDFAEPPAEPAALAELPDLAWAFGDRSVEFFGYAEQSVVTEHIGTSAGARWRQEDRAARFEVSAKSDNRRRSSWSGAGADSLSEIDVGAALEDVRAGLRLQERRIEVPAVPRTVILTPSAVADLMIVFWWAAVARDAAEGRSPFSGGGPGGTSLGRVVSPRDLSLRSDPAASGIQTTNRLWTPTSSPAATVFDTGLTIAAVDWVKGGKLAALAATRAGAAELGLPFTASAANLELSDAAGSGTLTDVIARNDDALVVTSLWYIRDVDPQAMLVTGLTRDGTYVVRDGRIVGGAGNFRFNDSPLAVLGRIVDAGAPVRCLPREWADYFTRTSMPPLVVRDFGLSTASAAV